MTFLRFVMSRLIVATITAIGTTIALYHEDIAQNVCIDVLNAVSISGEDLVARLDALPVYPESYYENKIERLD